MFSLKNFKKIKVLKTNKLYFSSKNTPYGDFYVNT